MMPSTVTSLGSDRPGMVRLTRSATIAIISILCVVVVGHDLFRTWQDRSRQVDEGRREVANLVLSADQQAEDAFRLATTSLGELVERVETDGAGPAQRERLRRVMAQGVARLPVLQSLDVIDDSGRFIADSRVTTPAVNVADREYFQYHRTHPDRHPYLSGVVRSRVSDVPIVIISQRIDRPDGGFGGVVAATIDVAFFQRFYRTFDLGHDGAAGLFRDDGTILVRQPFSEPLVGSRVRTVPPFSEPRPPTTSGDSEIISPLDGVVRIYGWRRVSGYPLVVAVALGKDEQLAAWRLGAGEHLLAAVTVALLLGFIALRLVERVRLLTRAERETAAANATAATSAAQYRLLADNAGDMIVAIDMQFNRRYVSPACRDLLGYEPESLVGGSPLSLVHPDDAALLGSTLKALALGQDRARISYRARHLDGHWLWLDASFKLIRESDSGTPIEIQSALRDISERMASLAALQQSEERFRVLLQSNAVTEAITMLDPDGIVETWNAAAERIQGYAPDEIIGRNFSVFFIEEDIASGVPASFLKRAVTDGTFVTEAWRVRKDGRRFLANVVIDAIHNHDGTLRGFVAATRDITEQRIEEEQRAIIIEAAPNGMLIVDEAGVITLANSQLEQIFDYPDGTLTGQPLEILVPEAFRAAHGELRSAFTSGRTDTGMAPQRQFIGRRRDGSAVTIEIMLSPVQTPRGRIVIASVFDVTDRIRLAAEQQAAEQRERLVTAANNASLERLAGHLARARDRAEQASRAKSRFLAGMSHELRTPLNGILGYAHLLHMEGGLNPAQSARVDAMLDAGRHLLEMITCVLDLSEIEAEQVLLRPVALDVTAIMAACLDLIRPMAQAKGLAMTIVLASEPPPRLVADPTRLRQILLNLLGNAAKFTSRGGIEVRFRTMADGTAMRIEVADTGPGILPEQRHRLFQEFERLDADAVGRVEGAGLGLALSARLAGLMDGSLGYDDNPGGGSVFWLELPLGMVVVDQPLVVADRSGLADAGMGLPKLFHVLVVDDVLMNREIAGSFLRAAGNSVVCVEGGAEAVAAVAGMDFDVVLMDVRMPGMDGLEATRRIRALRGARGQVPIVALTAQAFTEQVAACRGAGMDSHLSKPFDPDTLLAAVLSAVTTGRMPSETSALLLANRVPAAAAEAGLGPDAAEAGIGPDAAEAGIGRDNADVVSGSEMPVVDRARFDRTAGFLPPAAVDTYLLSIIELGDDLLHRLREPDSIARTGRELADTAHTLAGSAGMFGFERVSMACRRFEHAVQSGAAGSPVLAEGLIAALNATLPVIPALRPVVLAV